MNENKNPKKNSDNKQRFLKLEGGKVVTTTESIYKQYWHSVNHERYVERCNRKNVDAFVDDITINNITDTNANVEQAVEKRMLIELLRKSLEKLTEEEREIIDDVFFNEDNLSLRKVAHKHGMSLQALQRCLKKILNKLRTYIEQ